MNKRGYYFLAVLISILLFCFGFQIVSAQNETAGSDKELTVTAKDLGVGDPNILPDSPLYFLKNLGRGLRMFFAFSPEKKAELNLKFSSEKIMEAKKLADKGKEDLAEKILEKSEKDFEKAKEVLEKRKDDPRISRVLEKMAERAVKHQKILDNLERRFSLKRVAKIRQLKEKIVKSYLSSEKPEDIEKRISEVIKKENVSGIRRLKSIQVLMRLKEQAPPEAQKGLDQAIESQIKKLKEDLENLPEDRKRDLSNYLVRMGGDKTEVLEIINRLEKEGLSGKNLELIEASKEKLIEKINERLEKAEKENVPQLKERMLKRLEKGSLEKIEMLDDLERIVPLEVLPQVLETKRRAKEKFLQKIQKINPEERKTLLEKISKRANLKTLKILKDDFEILPPEEKEQILELKKKIEERIKNELQNSSQNPEELKEKIQRFLDANPEIEKEIDDLPVSSEIKSRLKEGVKKRLEMRLKSIQNPERLEKIKEKIEKQGVEISPKMLIERIQKLQASVKPKTVEAMIEKAERQLKRLNSEIRKEKEKVVEPEYKEIFQLVSLAEKEVESAKKDLKEKRTGEAFAQARAALAKIRICWKLLERMNWKGKIEEERLEKWKDASSSGKIPKSIISCPLPKKPKCLQGIFKKVKDKNGCIKFICEKIGKPRKPGVVCIEIWDPVCGVDGKTYSNACVAEKIAGVKIAYKGICKEKQERKCAGEGERINRNPFLGDTSLKCCPGLKEVRVSRSYSICIKPECEKDKDCPQSKCPGRKSECIEGKCLVPECPIEEQKARQPEEVEKPLDVSR